MQWLLHEPLASVLNNTAFCVLYDPHNQTVIISLNNINWLASVIDKECSIAVNSR